MAFLALADVIGTVLTGSDAAIRRERTCKTDQVVRKTEVTATEGRSGTHVRIRVVVPGPDYHSVDLDDEPIELFRRMLGKNANSDASAGAELESPAGSVDANSDARLTAHAAR